MIKIKTVDRVYNGFFKIDKVIFNQKRFNGSMMNDVVREVFIRKPVVFLSLFDPLLNKFLFVEQVRVGAMINDFEHPCVLEPIAGIIDEGETALDAAIREAKEETGLVVDIDSIKIIQSGYTTPGGSNEFAYYATGIFDSSTYEEQDGGVEGEMEDIRSHLIDGNEALDMIENGEINSLSGAFGVYWHKVHN